MNLSKTESILIKKIKQPIPKKLQIRFEFLNQKRISEILTIAEHEELIEITKKFEALNIIRLKAVADLSKNRQLPARELMTQLDITLKIAYVFY